MNKPLTISLSREEWHIAIQAMAGFRDHCTRMAQIVSTTDDVRAGLEAASGIAEVIGKIRLTLKGQENEGD